jgi:hypothetical protein
MKTITGWLLLLVGCVLSVTGLMKAFLVFRAAADIVHANNHGAFMHYWWLAAIGGVIGLIGLFLLGEYTTEDDN